MCGLCPEGGGDCRIHYRCIAMEWEGYPVLKTYVAGRISEYEQIPVARKKALNVVARRIREELDTQGHCSLVFICTHNSRRSHMGHLWATLAASFYDLRGLSFYSGGTEATAFNPRAVLALEESGMSISLLKPGNNPVHRVQFPGSEKGESVFSKRYSNPPNPSSGFIAIMTCSDADEACPIVMGAKARFAITYEDPGKYDDTAEETVQYRERSGQIAREMFFLFSKV